MSVHDITNCPECDKKTFVLKEDGEWVCLNPKCKFQEKMPETKVESTTFSDFIQILIAAIVVTLFMLVALGV